MEVGGLNINTAVLSPVSGNIAFTTTSGSLSLDLSHMRRTNGLTRGAVNTSVLIYSTAAESNGTDITYVNNANSGDSFLINTTGVYSVSVCFSNTATSACEIRVGTLDNNSDDSKTRIQTTNAALGMSLSWQGTVIAGQSIWYRNGGGTLQGSANANQITITRLR